MSVCHCLARFWLGGKRSRDYLAVRATLTARTRLHGARRGPNLRVVSVQAGPLRAPQPRTRERPAAGTENVADMPKKCIW